MIIRFLLVIGKNYNKHCFFVFYITIQKKKEIWNLFRFHSFFSLLFSSLLDFIRLRFFVLKKVNRMVSAFFFFFYGKNLMRVPLIFFLLQIHIYVFINQMYKDFVMLLLLILLLSVIPEKIFFVAILFCSFQIRLNKYNWFQLIYDNVLFLFVFFSFDTCI